MTNETKKLKRSWRLRGRPYGSFRQWCRAAELHFTGQTIGIHASIWLARKGIRS